MNSFPDPPTPNHDGCQLSKEVHSYKLYHSSTVISICFHECASVNVSTCKVFIEHAIQFGLFKLCVDFYILNTPELCPETCPVDRALLQFDGLNCVLIGVRNQLVLNCCGVAWDVLRVRLVFKISLKIIILRIYY